MLIAIEVLIVMVLQLTLFSTAILAQPPNEISELPDPSTLGYQPYNPNVQYPVPQEIEGNPVYKMPSDSYPNRQRQIPRIEGRVESPSAYPPYYNIWATNHANTSYDNTWAINHNNSSNESLSSSMHVNIHETPEGSEIGSTYNIMEVNLYDINRNSTQSSIHQIYTPSLRSQEYLIIRKGVKGKIKLGINYADER